MDFSDNGRADEQFYVTEKEPPSKKFSSTGECLYGKRRRTVGGIVLNVILAIIAFLLVGEIIFNSMYTGLYVVHSSMYPTLNGASSIDEAGGDYIYINENTVPTYGDIVVVFDENKKTNIIKRVVAFGGDSVKIVQGKLFLKKSGEEEFKQVEESYVSPLCNLEGVNVNALYYNYPTGGGEHLIAENSYFLLGDNRNDSSDSRDSANGVNGDYHKKFLVGVVPSWSLKFKSVSTAWHTFFNFTLRGKSINSYGLRRDYESCCYSRW